MEVALGGMYGSRLRPLVDETARPRIIADRNTAALDLTGADVDLARVRAAATDGSPSERAA